LLVDAGVVQARAAFPGSPRKRERSERLPWGGGLAPARAQTGRLRSVGNAASAWSGRRPAPPGI